MQSPPQHIIKFMRKYNKLATFQDNLLTSTNHFGQIVTYQFDYEEDGAYFNSGTSLEPVTKLLPNDYLDYTIRKLANSKVAGIDVTNALRVRNFTNSYYHLSIANINFSMYKAAYNRAYSITEWGLRINMYYTGEHLIMSYLDGKLKVFLPIDYTFFT
jgi:hypothetical protein